MQLEFFDDHFSCVDSDVVFTPRDVAHDMAQRFRFEGTGLDPCCGDGVFLKFLPAETNWCEIRRGVDFFDRQERADWIIGNPPYSLFTEWLTHSFRLSSDIVYLLPVNKVFGSWDKVMSIKRFGGIPTIRFYGAGRKIGFPFGFPCAAVHFKENYAGPTSFEYWQGSVGMA